MSRRRPLARRRKGTKRRKRNSPVVRFNRGVSVTPDAIFVKLRFVTGLSINGTSIASRVFRGNSAFDPDFTGVGSQPFGFDEWSALYNRYEVYASAISVHARSEQATVSSLSMISLTPSLTSVIPASGFDVIGEARTRKRMLQHITGGPPTFIKSFMSTRKMFGASKSYVNNTDFSATAGLNPNQVWFWHLVIQQVTGAATAVDSECFIEITYYLKWFERTPLARS